MKNQRIVMMLLRLGVSSVYLYAGVSSIISPFDWVAFVPPYLNAIIPQMQLLLFLSVAQILLGVWLLTGLKTFYASVLSTLFIVGAIGFNLNALDITFRDFTIFFTSLALAIETYQKR